VPRIAFGLVPLTTPYSESDPDHRILNAVERGLLFERMKEPAKELEMSKAEYNRTIRGLKNEGLIYVGSDGKYYLTFMTSNFPNLIAREDRI
jgi:DNA-binding IclR family transcriptional regulator